MQNEIWKDVVGYENIYQISNLANVRSVDRVVLTRRGPKKYKSKLLTPHIANSGYKEIRLNNSDGGKTYLLHRLVALAFLENPDKCKIVNHIDGDKTNAIAENLEWCDYSKNNKHAYDSELNTNKKIISQETRSEIREIYFSQKITQSKLARRYNVSQNTISKIVRGV